jgi:hypothetical protein
VGTIDWPSAIPWKLQEGFLGLETFQERVFCEFQLVVKAGIEAVTTSRSRRLPSGIDRHIVGVAHGLPELPLAEDELTRLKILLNGKRGLLEVS